MQKTLSSPRPAPKSKNGRVFGFGALLLALAGGAYFAPRPASQKAQLPPVATPVTFQQAAPKVSWQLLQSFPHDTTAFTEGLLWHDGALWESTGLEGHSTLRRVDLASGAVLDEKKLAPRLFGEGLALANDKLFQLTWQSKIGFVYDLKFRPQRTFFYGNEGWGLTFDGENLIQSDGTDVLTFRDPATFAATKQLKVTWDGQPRRDLNELEWIEGEIWANVWKTDLIARIDPQTGKVKSYLDLSGILPLDARNGGEDVLNGIAYDAQNKRIFVTGKNWAKLFWIKVER